jgi:hypothetical protein
MIKLISNKKYRSGQAGLCRISINRAAILIFLVIFLKLSPLSAQKSYPKEYFRPPVDFRMLLSGTFGELRTNHFHSGIDIKTAGAEGKPVYAIADGYVSRIKVSAFGFGKALYITHLNGYVSVYAHLSRYNDPVASAVFQEHYRQESFEIEMFPAKDEFPVKKGDVVAYSGNSGSSAGPHLHFEIRDEGSQKPINPLLFGYDVKDTRKPRIAAVKIYPADENARIDGLNKAVKSSVEIFSGQYRLNSSRPFEVNGNISFGIQVYDQLDDSDNKNGPFSVRLLIDSSEVFHAMLESFSFDETRYVNSFIDYEEFIRSGARFQKTRIDPGNNLGIYLKASNRGIFTFTDTLLHTISYEVKDAAGNLSALSFLVKSTNVKTSLPSTKTLSAKEVQKADFRYDTENRFSNSSVILEAPRGAFYDSFEFRYDSVKRLPGTWSALHRIHNKYVPVHDYITLGIRAGDDLPKGLRDKALIVRVSEDGKDFTSEGGEWEKDGFVRTRIREFGRYCITVDTVPPVISPVSPETFSDLSGKKSVKFTISDNLSGIKSYRGTLNGKWVLLDYDAKNRLLVYRFDDRIGAGENKFELKVTDGRQNQSVYRAVLVK